MPGENNPVVLRHWEKTPKTTQPSNSNTLVLFSSVCSDCSCVPLQTALSSFCPDLCISSAQVIHREKEGTYKHKIIELVPCKIHEYWQQKPGEVPYLPCSCLITYPLLC